MNSIVTKSLSKILMKFFDVVVSLTPSVLPKRNKKTKKSIREREMMKYRDYA